MNTGQIVKSKHAGNFTIVPNEALKSGELSLKAKGLLAYLLAMPHNWAVYKSQLCKYLPEGRKAIDAAFKELKDARYILSTKGTDKNGRFEWKHIVSDKPLNENGEVPIEIEPVRRLSTKW